MNTMHQLLAPESWRRTWRQGVAPLLSTRALEALYEGLKSNDTALCQGQTTSPPCIPALSSFSPDACCAIGYCGWKGEELETVNEIDQFFARMCFEIDERMGEKAACRYFLNWFDGTPRLEMIHELLGEVELALQERGQAA